jgi:N-glycosylase/DNA lyase
MGTQSLINWINELKGNPKIKQKIDAKLNEFVLLKESPEEWFSELCFCILTANSTAERCMKVQQQVGAGFKNLPLKELKKKMKLASCRFYNKRAEYIVEAREKFNPLLVKQFADKNPLHAREWLVENIKGIGMKEASHFLRNIGYNIAIADFHIIDILKRYRFLPAGMVLNIKNYFWIEKKLSELAKKFGMTLGELDLYLWYMETGKILK